MKLTSLIILLLAFHFSFAQKKETIVIPKGIVYNYCDPKIVEKAKKLIADNLSENSDYKLLDGPLIIGPELWKRYKDNENIQKIEKGRIQFQVDHLILEGKLSQNNKDSRIIWDELKKEVSKEFIIRKATEDELKYYWSVISFDIDEPLLIIETKEHNYILNLLKKDLKLLWLDEAPRTTATTNDSGFVTYQNGKEVDAVSKGIKETKLEKDIFLNSDDVLKENVTIDDITLIADKTNLIFDELFKKSTESGKIMVHFELNPKVNAIQFSIKGDVDLEIMKEFERRINNEIFPNSKKDTITLQFIYKINSFDDTE
jgi:hypothetical protein